MSVRKELAVEYHRQDKGYYCGAACAQMVLAQIGAGLLDQEDLYADIHSHNATESGWATGPDGLTWTLNHYRPVSFTHNFQLFALANKDSISRKIVWTIEHYEVAPVALVFGRQHWIVIHGYEASSAPISADDATYTITAFDIHVPWSPTPGLTSRLLHTPGDACGAGSICGLANRHITYESWEDHYITGVPSGYWGGKYLAICDFEPPVS